MQENKGFWQITKNLDNVAACGLNTRMKKGVQSEGRGGLLYVSKASSPLKLPKKVTHGKLKINF